MGDGLEIALDDALHQLPAVLAQMAAAAMEMPVVAILKYRPSLKGEHSELPNWSLLT
jgi:hypothetical protein